MLEKNGVLKDISFKGKSAITDKYIEGLLSVSTPQEFVGDKKLKTKRNFILMVDKETGDFDFVFPKTISRYSTFKDNSPKNIKLYDNDVVFDEDIEEYGLIIFKEGKFKVVYENLEYDLCDRYKELEFIGEIEENRDKVKPILENVEER